MRTCKDIIDAYFVVKARAGALNAAGPAVSAAAQDDADLAVARLGALGTYLANLRGEEVRVQYTQLTTTLAAAVTEARRLQPAELAGRIRTADGIFAGLNADCIKSARDAPI